MRQPDDDGTAPSGVENPKASVIPEEIHAVASPIISKKALAILRLTLSTVKNSLIPKVAVTAAILFMNRGLIMISATITQISGLIKS